MKFTDSYSFVQEYVKQFGGCLEVSWKIHIIANHIIPFIEYTGHGLGHFAEQCGEAIHAKFKPTWQRYKTGPSNEQYGRKLKSSIVNFGVKRL